VPDEADQPIREQRVQGRPGHQFELPAEGAAEVDVGLDVDQSGSDDDAVTVGGGATRDGDRWGDGSARAHADDAASGGRAGRRPGGASRRSAVALEDRPSRASAVAARHPLPRPAPGPAGTGSRFGQYRPPLSSTSPVKTTSSTGTYRQTEAGCARGVQRRTWTGATAIPAPCGRSRRARGRDRSRPTCSGRSGLSSVGAPTASARATARSAWCGARAWRPPRPPTVADGDARRRIAPGEFLDITVQLPDETRPLLGAARTGRV